jgi:MFS family permease
MSRLFDPNLPVLGGHLGQPVNSPHCYGVSSEPQQGKPERETQAWLAEPGSPPEPLLPPLDSLPPFIGNGTSFNSVVPTTPAFLAAEPLAAEPPSSEPVPAIPPPAESLAPLPQSGFRAVLRNTNFLKLWLGQVFSQLADKVYLVLIIALITSEFQSQGQTVSGWVSSIMVAFTIPAVLFGSVAGVFVDRWSKKQVLVLTNLWRGGLVLVLPILLWLVRDWGSPAGVPMGFWILLAVTFGVSTLTQFFAPAEQATMPLIVERTQLLSANSLYTLTMMVAVIVGFAAGEPLLALADTLTGYFGIGTDWGRELVVGGSYTLAGLILLLMRTAEPAQDPDKEPPHVWRDIQEGLRYLQSQPRVRAALIQLVIVFSVFAALAVLVVRLAEVIPDIQSAQFGFLMAAGGVGMATGALAIGRSGQRFSHRQLSLIGSVGMAVMLTGLAVFHLRLWPVMALFLGLGMFAALVGIPMQTTIQEETPEEMRGKIFGLQNNVVNIALSLPLVLAGVAETLLGLQPVLLGLGVILFVGGVLTWVISKEP